MKKLLILIFIILLSCFVSANTYKIDNIKCVGDMHIQINNVSGDTNYLINNCTGNLINYNCSCNTIPEFSNNFTDSSLNFTTIAFRLQYYINHLTGNDIEDQKYKRVQTRTIQLKQNETVVLIADIGEKVDVVSFIMWFIFIVLLLGVFIAVLFLVIFMNIDKMKRWLGMDDKPVTFWDIVVAIFKRKKIEQLSLKKKNKNINSYEDEVKRIMKNL